MTKLCAECAPKYTAWLDYRPPRGGGGVRISANAAYDDTAAGVADARRHRADSTAALIREQRAAIAEKCRREHTTE